METYELENLVKSIAANGYETQHMEIKLAAKGTPSRLYDTFSSFANQEGGGIIIFGIDESEEFRIAGVYDVQDLQAKVGNAALLMEPEVRPYFTILDYDGKTVVAAQIPECDPDRKPCYYRPSGRIRGSFIRVGEADLPMSEYEVY